MEQGIELQKQCYAFGLKYFHSKLNVNLGGFKVQLQLLLDLHHTRVSLHSLLAAFNLFTLGFTVYKNLLSSGSVEPGFWI